MTLPSLRPRILLALLAFLPAVFACTSLLCAQNGPAPKSESDTAASPADPAFVARANATLIHARKILHSFYEQTSNDVCTENVSQTIIGKNNKPIYREESTFEYQLQSSSRSGSLRLVESREARKPAFRDPNKTLLITNGFASMLLVLHPTYESSYVFEPLGEETVDGRTLLKLHFKPVPGTASPAAIQLRGRNYPLPLKGDIWIDEQSGAVVKLLSSLDGGLDDLGLLDLRSEIHYSIVPFQEPE